MDKQKLVVVLLVVAIVLSAFNLVVGLGISPEGFNRPVSCEDVICPGDETGAAAASVGFSVVEVSS